MNTVLILHAGALGDCILTTRLAIALQQRGDVTVTLAARSFGAARWLTLVGLVQRAAQLELLPFHQLFREDGAPDNALVMFLRQFDLIIHMIDRFGGTADRRLRELGIRVIAIDPAPQPEDDRHITDQWLCQMMPSLPDLEVPSIDSIVPYLPPPRLGRIIIHPGSGGREKCCPLQLLIDVVNRLTAVGLEVEWMLGPVEIELFDTPMRQKMEESAPVSCYREVEHAARAVAGSKAFVGNDAGMTHVAGVCGVPTLALFGPTNPRIWRPLGPRVRTFDFRTLSADELADAITTYVS